MQDLIEEQSLDDFVDSFGSHSEAFEEIARRTTLIVIIYHNLQNLICLIFIARCEPAVLSHGKCFLGIISVSELPGSPLHLKREKWAGRAGGPELEPGYFPRHGRQASGLPCQELLSSFIRSGAHARLSASANIDLRWSACVLVCGLH